ncbi:hypothetical protein ACSNOI_32315 [Actinomadura kijaniata]|uniref:hypothetical protein n=1 Tax=Actinomadura kijaniata TaxID=46161 RepID=UPI003F1D2533
MGPAVLLTAAEGIGPAVASYLAAALEETEKEFRDHMYGAGFNASARRATLQVFSLLSGMRCSASWPTTSTGRAGRRP